MTSRESVGNRLEVNEGSMGRAATFDVAVVGWKSIGNQLGSQWEGRRRITSRKSIGESIGNQLVFSCKIY